MTRAQTILEKYWTVHQEDDEKRAMKSDKWDKYDKETGRSRAMQKRTARQPEKRRK